MSVTLERRRCTCGMTDDPSRRRRRGRFRRHRRSSTALLVVLSTAAVMTAMMTTTTTTVVPCVRAFSVPSDPSFPSSSSSFDRPPPPMPPPPFEYPQSPEEAIQNQLHYYKFGRLDVAYHECCSPGNKATIGSYAEFVRLVKSPPYDLILEHDRADVLLELANVSHGDGMYGMMGMGDDEEHEEDEDEYEDADENEDEVGEEGDGDDDDMEDANEARILNVACCLVCIRPNKRARSGHPVWFWWEMSLVEDVSSTTSMEAMTIPTTKMMPVMASVLSDAAAAAAAAVHVDVDVEDGDDGRLLYDDFDNGTTTTMADIPSSSSWSLSSSVGTMASSAEIAMTMTSENNDDARRPVARWLVDCISPDFEDLDFETESLSIEDFMDDDDDDDDDEGGGDYDDITIFLDF